jgi:phospholipid-translocating ATPase
MFWYLPFNGFDATYLYQYTFILLYNLVFTSLPVIILGGTLLRFSFIPPID